MFGFWFLIMFENDLKNIKKIFEKAKKGNKEAFSEIYETYFKPLYRYVYLKTSNKEESDDLVQDIFIRAFDYEEGSDSRFSSPIIYFYSVARVLVLDWKRKRRRVKSPSENMENYFEMRVGKDEYNSRKEELVSLLKALGKISHEEQDAIIFKFTTNFSNKEVGLLLGISARSVRRLETQGIISFKDILKQQYEQQS